MTETASATKIVEPELPEPRYSYGGDEWLFCELSQEMSFHANFKALAICQELGRRDLPGVSEICPGNASYLLRFDPDEIRPEDLLGEARSAYDAVSVEDLAFHTRVVDVPVLYDDPWTRECLLRFRDRHQDPNATDLEYVARVNGFATTDEFIAAHHGSPYYVTMVGFVVGTAWCFQMRPRERMLQVPKYVRPRTDTPALALSHGGAFAAIYPVRGPGGYQLFGMAAAPIYDPTQALPDFQDSVVFARAGDIWKFRPVELAEFEALRAQVEAGTFRYRTVEVEFEPARFFDDPDRYNDELLGRLY